MTRQAMDLREESTTINLLNVPNSKLMSNDLFLYLQISVSTFIREANFFSRCQVTQRLTPGKGVKSKRPQDSQL